MANDPPPAIMYRAELAMDVSFATNDADIATPWTVRLARIGWNAARNERNNTTRPRDHLSEFEVARIRSAQGVCRVRNPAPDQPLR